MLAKQNKPPVFRTGRKQLINLDKLIEYLSGDIVEEDFRLLTMAR